MLTRVSKQSMIIIAFLLMGLLSIYKTFPYNIDIASYYEKHHVISKWQHLEFAAFGTSDTYGSGIPTEKERQELAYPFLLSSHANNYAIRASSPNYPRACAQSIIEKESATKPGTIMDVIILEYFVRGYTGTIALVERLRTRYPDALIIILRDWNPLMNVFVEMKENGNTKSMNACAWAKSKGLHIFEKENLKKTIGNFPSEDDIQWTWKQIDDQDKISVQEEAARLYGAHILPMERPKNVRDWMDFADLFAPDCHHKSIMGHAEVANRISQFIDKIGIVQNPRLGEWSYLDQCTTWFESGNTAGIEYSEDIRLEEFANRNGPKYALSFREKTGTIKVRNHSDAPMDLYLTYMSTGPGPSKYPPTNVHIMKYPYSETERKEATQILLDVQASPDWNNAEVHVQKMQEVGSIQPGETTLSFNSVGDSEWPFRLVSTIITKRVQNSNIHVQDERSELSTVPGHALNLV